MIRQNLYLFSLLFFFAACGGKADPQIDGGADTGPADQGNVLDQGDVDTGVGEDLPITDATQEDLLPNDLSIDTSSPDEGSPDAPLQDEGAPDTKVQDEGPSDEGAPDQGVDEGTIEEDVPVQIEDEGGSVDPGEPGLPEGTPCVEDFVCDSDFCAPSNEGQICGQLCEGDGECAEGWSCVFLEDYDASYCLEFDLHLCRPCNSHDECNVLSGDQNALCVNDGIYEGSFCATSCGDGGTCPDGYSCESVDNDGVSSDVCRPDSGDCTCGVWSIIEGASTQCGVENCYSERSCGVTGLSECPALTPEDEVCDGVDNNCDGLTDNELTAPLADLQLGICLDAVKVCDGSNGWIEPGYGPDYESTETRCDGLDNDCDDSIDEELSPPLSENQLGVCDGEIKVCAGTDGWVEPDYTLNTEFEALEAQCDGLDNDCDGATDNGLEPPLGTLFEGVCSTVTQSCEGADGWQDPEYANLISTYESTESLCDGLDNDCDAQTDEDLTPPDADKQEGPCAGQIKLCGGSDGWLEPDYTLIADYESTEATCDGIDNDCNGETDDGLVGPLNENQTGVCEGSTNSCDGVTGWIENLATAVGYEAEEVTCDGLDNDCDNEVDEDLGTTTCGDGVCENTVPACTEGAPTECLPLDAASDEICDGIDTDCDGALDNDAPCDDTIPCTVDTCGGAQGCIFTPDHAPCQGLLDPSDSLCKVAECDPTVGCQVVDATGCCGNGVVEGDEACDDGNDVAEDGCAPSCTVEPGASCVPGDPSVCDFEITISENTFNVDVSVLLGNPTIVRNYTLMVAPGVIVGSEGASLPAMTTGNLPEGASLTLVNKGRIQGMGGSGSGSVGGDGGDALHLTVPTTIDNTDGEIWSGGGGGGGGAFSPSGGAGSGAQGGGPGGGGAGTLGGNGGNCGAAGPAGQAGHGSATAGGGGGVCHFYVGTGGTGGGPGQDGAPGTTNGVTPPITSGPHPGGLAGKAILGNNQTVTFVEQGDIRGVIEEVISPE